MFTAASCAVDNGDEVYISELGAVQKEHIVSAERGTVEIQVLANAGWQAEFTDVYDDWVKIENPSNTNDGKIRIAYQTNDNFARMAALRVWSPERADTVYIKQRGAKTPLLSLPNSNIVVSGAGGDTKARLNTNIDIEDIDFDIIYTSNDEGGWIKDYRFTNGLLIFDCENNPLDAPRNARVRLSFTDGWGTEHSATLFQTQRDRNEKLGDPVDFDALRNMSGSISENLLLQGVIVSNQTYRNAGDLEQLAATSLSHDAAKCTAYIQSLDGRYGFRLMCASQDDNTFKQYSKVSIMLKGAEISRDFDEAYPDVESFTISGITSTMVVESEAGSKASITEKKRKMSELTDSDIYTYVTLTDCEFPIRKGSLTPINEGYGHAANQQRIGKFPLLMRDIDGNSMYLLTNTTCTYRRNGSQLPYGSGNISGVVVHEKFEHMSRSKTIDDYQSYGDIGLYQLRHQTRDDIYAEMNENFEDGFSKLAFEVRYLHLEGGKALATEDGMAGYITTTSIHPQATLRNEISFSSLESPGKNGPTEGSCGMDLLTVDGGSNYVANIAWDNNYGNTGRVQSLKGVQNDGVTVAPAVATQYVWNYQDTTDGAGGSADGFLVNFSSKGITKPMSMQIAVFTTGTANVPRWWKIEWSESGTKQSTWKSVGWYNTSVGELWAGACMWNMAAASMFNIDLPAEMNNRDNVYLRLVPRVNATSDYSEFYKPAQQIEVDGNGKGPICVLDYIGIRYNK